MRLTRHVAGKIRRLARASRPEECCGIVFASAGEPDRGVLIHPSANVDVEDPRRRYKLDHRVHLRAVEAELSGVARILAYYHSHPTGPAEPSPNDARSACPGVTYLIVAAEGPQELRAWRESGGEFLEETVVEEAASEEGIVARAARD